MTAKKKREFSSVPVEVSWAAQAIGGCMALFGVLASRSHIF